MAIILMSFGNKEEEICLKNQENSNITNSGKTLQIISQNETHTSFVITCDSSVINEQGDIFSIEGPYTLNCNKSRVFSYIDKITLWNNGTCVAKKKYPDFPNHMPVQNYSTTIMDYFSYCGWWKNCSIMHTFRLYYFREMFLGRKDFRISQEKWCNNRTYISNFISGTLFISSIWILET
jgi:hypothetical protein